MKNAAHPPQAPSGALAQPHQAVQAQAVQTQPMQAQPTQAQSIQAFQPGEGRATERWTVDGLEDSPAGPLARLERQDGATFDLPLRFLPAGLREGDLLEVQDGLDGVTVRRLEAETAARQDAMQTQLEALNRAEGDQDGSEEFTV